MPGARHFSELIAWQIADQLRRAVFEATGRETFARDLKRRGQIEDAVDSVCRNIAEGFGCDTHREFARFLGIARRSLNEVNDSLHSARLKGYVSVEQQTAMQALPRRLYPAISRLKESLRRPDPRQSDRTDRGE